MRQLGAFLLSLCLIVSVQEKVIFQKGLKQTISILRIKNHSQELYCLKVNEWANGFQLGLDCSKENQSFYRKLFLQAETKSCSP